MCICVALVAEVTVVAHKAVMALETIVAFGTNETLEAFKALKALEDG